MLAAAGKLSCWLFTGLGRQVWAGRSRLQCRQSCLDWPDNMGSRPMAMPTRTAFLETKTSTPEASIQGPRCSYSAKSNRTRSRSKTSVQTSGTCGRKSEFVSVQPRLLNGQNVVNISNGNWSRVDPAAAATGVGFAARHSWCRVKADAWLKRSAIHPTALRRSSGATSRLMLECSGRPQLEILALWQSHRLAAAVEEQLCYYALRHVTSKRPEPSRSGSKPNDLYRQYCSLRP
jgi:hypothetical protein